MQSSDTVKALLKTEFGNYSNVECSSSETLGDVISRLQGMCGSSINITNFRLNGKTFQASDDIAEIFCKGNKSASSSKIYKKHLCRLCAQSSRNLSDIFSPTADYSEMIRSCLSIEVNHNDKLPIRVCTMCIKILMEFYKFKQKTTEAELKLKSYFKCSDTLASSFRSVSVILESNELFQTSEADCDISQHYDDSTDDIFGCSENNDDIKMTNEPESGENEDIGLCCKWCNMVFDSATKLYNHSLTHSNTSRSDGDKHGLNVKKKIRKIHRRVLKKQSCYLCTICDQVFPVKQLFLLHCNEDHKSVRKNVVTLGIIHLSKVYSCSNCGAKYIGMKQLSQHTIRCLIPSLSNSELQIERKKLWCVPLLNEVKYTCEYCKEKFKTSRHFKRHKVGNMQLSANKFSCNDCKRLFSTVCALKWHIKSHSEIRDYICEICGKTYTRLAALQKHKVQHSKDKPFTCSVCGKAFKIKAYLQAHERTHTGFRPYTCLACNNKFKTSGALAKHRRTHFDFRPYSCSVCSALFKTSYGLKVHMLTHTGENPYKCEHCDITFRYRKDMVKHCHNVEIFTTKDINCSNQG